LAGASVDELTIDETSFQISGPSGTMNLKADTPEIRAEWVTELRKEISNAALVFFL
jgi:hypothetical protein